jgi:hypothetical protein
MSTTVRVSKTARKAHTKADSAGVPAPAWMPFGGIGYTLGGALLPPSCPAAAATPAPAVHDGSALEQRPQWVCVELTSCDGAVDHFWVPAQTCSPAAETTWETDFVARWRRAIVREGGGQEECKWAAPMTRAVVTGTRTGVAAGRTLELACCGSTPKATVKVSGASEDAFAAWCACLGDTQLSGMASIVFSALRWVCETEAWRAYDDEYAAECALTLVVDV